MTTEGRQLDWTIDRLKEAESALADSHQREAEMAVKIESLEIDLEEGMGIIESLRFEVKRLTDIKHETVARAQRERNVLHQKLRVGRDLLAMEKARTKDLQKQLAYATRTK